ncbi:MAG: hypothetical protein Q7S74_05885 [Nanoarchaeota archaeon]|nr:hypothetical protein [Nanoarchaeota archaeon]
MKATLILVMFGLLVLSVVPGVLAVQVGTGITPIITTEQFEPMVFMCDHRIVLDDNVEPGRISDGGQELIERINNYAFEGEQISWKILVFDKNGIEKVNDVHVTIGSSQGEGNDLEANCHLDDIISSNESIDSSCNARVLEEQLDYIPENTGAYYTCIFTVETPESMYGEFWVTVEATDIDGLMGTMAENEFWFFNPVVALSIDGDMTFDNVRPGVQAYSSTMTVGNDADQGSGVMMDMFISGTDFYDSASSGAKCPTTNQLALTNFRYFVSSGAYSTSQDLGIGRGARAKDAEGYVGIGYGNGFNNPNPFYDGYEILQAAHIGPYYAANVLAPGAEMAITFKLSMPEPCNGNFDTGSIFFWGEAI